LTKSDEIPLFHDHEGKLLDKPSQADDEARKGNPWSHAISPVMDYLKYKAGGQCRRVPEFRGHDTESGDSVHVPRAVNAAMRSFHPGFHPDGGYTCEKCRIYIEFRDQSLRKDSGESELPGFGAYP
jgi:hypothetical protein